MQPNSLFYSDGTSFGEFNENNKLHGRGIRIGKFDIERILIGYWENGCLSTGNYIIIRYDGVFQAGEKYYKDGVRGSRGTSYYTDGTEKKCGF